jgi:hypothetical protein
MRLMDNKIEKRSQATLNVYSRIQSAQELAELVSVSPDWSRQKGTPRGREPGNVHPHSVIAFDSDVDPSAPIQAHVENLLHRLSPARDTLRQFARRARSDDEQMIPMRFWLNVESTDGTIGFGLANEQLKAISDMGQT